ncbi:MAG: serine hydrolase [Spirochaetales bacterium]
MQPTETQKTLQFIEQYVPEAMRETKTPGCSVALMKDEEIIYEGGFGWRDRERFLPATADTLYGIGSCTKAFVATAILLLVERGALKLEDPVGRYIPLKLCALDGASDNSAEGGPITIHHLLTHSSGLPSLSTSEILLQQGLGLDTGVPLASIEDFYRWVNGAQGEISTRLGERFFYSNESYRMLGHIIQTVSGMPFHQFVSKNILEPLGMSRTTFVRSEYERDADKMRPYWAKPDGTIVPAEFPYPDVGLIPDFSFVVAAGGLISSVREMMKFLGANVPGSAAHLLKPETLAKMQTKHINRSVSYYGENGYGYGWTITSNFLRQKMIAHGGSIEVSTAYAAFLPEKRTSVMLASNSSGMPHATITEGIFAALLGLDPFKAIPALQIKDRMKLLAGMYSSYRNAVSVRIFAKGGLLYLEQKNPFLDSVAPLVPEDDHLRNYRFYTLTEGVRQPIEFQPGPNGIDLSIERDRYHKVG